MKKTEVAKAVVSTAAGIAMAVVVGQIMPVNLQSVSKDLSIVAASDFSTATTSNEWCCGPHYQRCPQFRCAAPY